jgi:hypothetical protein
MSNKINMLLVEPWQYFVFWGMERRCCFSQHRPSRIPSTQGLSNICFVFIYLWFISKHCDSGYTESNDKMLSKWHGKDGEGTGCSSIWGVILEFVRRNTIKMSEHYLSRLTFKQVRPEHKSITTCAIVLCLLLIFIQIACLPYYL